jgi:hypothetical protein
LSSYLGREPQIAKGALFKIADLYETLNKIYLDRKKSNFFKKLFNPTKMKSSIKKCFESSDSHFLQGFSDANNKIYDELSPKILESIWLKNKITVENKIYVHDENLVKERTENLDEFISNYMRALRNTHHGYFTETDNYKNPSRYFILTNGNIPDSISYLPFLWFLSFLNSKREFIEFDSLNYNYPRVFC